MSLRYFFSLLTKAAGLDILDINYEMSSEKMNIGGTVISASFKRGILFRLVSFCWHMIRALTNMLLIKTSHIPRHSIILWALSKNEADSLGPICLTMNNRFLVDNSNGNARHFNWFLAYLISIPYLPLVIITLLKSRNYRRQSFQWAFDSYWMIYGLYASGRMWLRRLQPKAIVFSNQVHAYCRVLERGAKDESVTSVFLQHASSPAGIPSFTHDYALLQGYHDLETASMSGGKGTKFFLVGVPKYDAYASLVNNNKTICSICICLNQLDNFDAVENLVNEVREAFPIMRVILRAHHGDRRMHLWRKLAEKTGIGFSDAITEPAYAFLKNVDVTIAGDSNILLESAMMNVLPIYYDFPEKHLDWYGFERNGLVEYFCEPQAICKYIGEIVGCKPFIRNKAKYYNATINTEYDGRSSELVKSVLEDIIVSGKEIDFGKWERIPDIQVEAYEVKEG
jgi:hypothetical protein